MLTKLNNGVITVVKSLPVPVSMLCFTAAAVMIALPLALGAAFFAFGRITWVDAIITASTTTVICIPVSYLICSAILHLHRSEKRLARTQSELAGQVGDLAAARHNAVAANKAKSAFLAQMSHELRTPLNAVIGFSDMLAKQDELGTNLSRDDVIEYAGLISQGGNTLLSLVNDLLDLSKIEAGEMQLSPERFGVMNAVENAVSCVSILAGDRGISLTVDVPFQGLEVRVDKRALSQILVNLLSNAIKFSPGGSAVTVGVRRTSRFLDFTVTDHGSGMTREEQARAVQPFMQLSNAMIATDKGTGLGLPIVKSLIELEGGTLLIDSEPGDGTIVSARYPADRIVNVRQPLALSA